ncbi:MAG: thioredoxin [Chloroflexi bacterium]|nr:thioredoxin [Chloroflexota bacterium]
MPFNIPIHTNAQSIDRVLNAGLPVILVFERKHCEACRQLQPTLDRLAADYAGKILIAKIDADSEGDLVRRYQITQVPSLVFIKQGQKIATAVGAASLTDLRSWCDYLSRGGVRPPLPQGVSESLPGTPSTPRPRPASQPSSPSQTSDSKPIHVTDANFDQVINGPLPVLVDFWAPWCGPCHMIAPAVEALAKEFAGKLVVAKLNVDENQRTASRYSVMSIPTLIIFRNGKAVDRVTGALPAPLLRQRVLPHIH